MSDPKDLPEGKTCGDCVHFEVCEMDKWIEHVETDDRCDWSPIKFQEKPAGQFNLDEIDKIRIWLDGATDECQAFMSPMESTLSKKIYDILGAKWRHVKRQKGAVKR